MNLKTAFVSLAASSFWAAEVVVGQLQFGKSTGEIAGGIRTCEPQRQCITPDISLASISCGGTCAYRVCLTMCQEYSHTCVPGERGSLGFPENQCFDTQRFSTTTFTNNGNPKNPSEVCQTVQAGTSTLFYFKAGGGPQACSGSATVVEDVEDNVHTFTCAPLDVLNQGNCAGQDGQTGDPNNGCAWVYQAPGPEECPTAPHVFGDPHIKTWSGRYYQYHGECDMIMMENPSFGNGLGLDLHIRTTIEDFYSAITSAAIRIGSDVLEVDGKDIYYNFHKVEKEDAPDSIAGFPINYVLDKKGNIHTEIDIGNGEKILFQVRKGFMAVDFEKPSKQNFQSSNGLLGAYGSGLLIGPDGFTEYKDTTEFAEQWQVKDTDDKLFHDLRAPQYPQKCKLPQTAETKKLRRLQKTLSREQAAAACAHWPKQGQESCIFDVMMTGDLEMADEPF